jgi:hypothetical protein
MIHISPTTNHYLTNVMGGYVTELRGEVIVKVSIWLGTVATINSLYPGA